jgi:hypothetical protein
MWSSTQDHRQFQEPQLDPGSLDQCRFLGKVEDWNFVEEPGS